MKSKLLQRMKGFLIEETVFAAAFILAAISAVFVRPGPEYLAYIDWRVLGILLSLMIVMAGLQKNGIFDRIGAGLLKRTGNTAELTGVLVFLCFFSSMFITNDVALLTFAPFAVATLQKCRQERLMVLVLVLQTIAANLGSMLTPIGNPQNLYLFHHAGMEMGEFLILMLPYTAAAGIFLLLIIFILSARKMKITMAECPKMPAEGMGGRKKNAVYILFFLLSLMVVMRMLPFYPVLFVIFVTVFFIDREVLKNVDYFLVFTFICFFIFTGNIGNIPAVKDTLEGLVKGREIMTGILASQVVSNVPAALLLSGFTANYGELLLGVNLGGLGTLIASMASLITYKIYAHHYNRTKGIYLFWFTAANLVFLALLILVSVGMHMTN